MALRSLARLGASACLLACAVAAPAPALPTVDLGTSIHQAITFNATGNFYNFSNIRYAEAPTGPRRFRAPVAVAGRNRTVDNGSVGRICPPAMPEWLLTTLDFIPDYLSGQQYSPPSSGGGSAPPPDPRITEDCLFLDVIVPKEILDAAARTKRVDAPVLVWIYGGGYVFGDKSGYDPTGLLAHSSEPFIFVALNYRVGAFGFLSGQTISANGTPQPGFLDQRLALEWVREKIQLFGGSPDRVTVMGESAGAGSVMHQITAYGGQRGPAPFQRAVMQSPAFAARPHSATSENITQAYLRQCNVTSVDALRQLPAATLMQANAAMVAAADYGSFVFGPAVDGSFVPALPGVLLAAGRFDQALEVVVGHNLDEGLLFTGPQSNNSAGLATALTEYFPQMSAATRQHVEADIYPASAYSGIEADIDRTKQMIGDTFVSCNTHFVANAFRGRAAAYEFAVPPGLHGSDVTYTFNDGKNTSGVITSTSTAMQRYLADFAVRRASGTPHSYPSDTSMTVFGASNVTTSPDDTANPRCQFWQKAQVDNLL